MNCIWKMAPIWLTYFDSLMSVSIWKLMPEAKRETFFEEYPPLRKLWNNSLKKSKSAGMCRVDCDCNLLINY